MDFLDSVDLHNTDEKSHRVRSWYLYEQYKSLENNQLDATKKLKNKSYQDRILHRELSERRARRQFSAHSHFSLQQNDSLAVRSDTSRTPFSESTETLFESVCDQEDVVSGIGAEDTLSQQSEKEKLFDDFRSTEDKIEDLSRSESIGSVLVNADINKNLGDDIKDELEFVKKNITEIINLQLEAEKECYDNYTELCVDSIAPDNESLNSIDSGYLKSSIAIDRYNPKGDNHVNRILAIWSKLVAFSYKVMQTNRANCYYEYSSQLLVAVLAVDVLRRGISRMCHILQPYVCPIKFANDDSDALSDSNKNIEKSHSTSRNSNKNIEHKCYMHRTKNQVNPRTCERKYHSEDRWCLCKYSLENRMNEMRNRCRSEPNRSAAKHCTWKNSAGEQSYSKLLRPYKKDKCFSNCTCKCSHLKKAVSPIIRLSRYLDTILREIDN